MATINTFVRPCYTSYMIGNMLKGKREVEGLSEEELSEKLHISLKALKMIESGNKVMTFTELQKVSEYIGVSVEELTRVEKDEDVVGCTICRSNEGDEPESETVDTMRKAQKIFHEALGQMLLRRNFTQ